MNVNYNDKQDSENVYDFCMKHVFFLNLNIMMIANGRKDAKTNPAVNIQNCDASFNIITSEYI